jgi:hypothetical protein|tara:strand:+ start:847 stop:1197 length:351 start_codon:yes stop_codon:yes gene_type:complete
MDLNEKQMEIIRSAIKAVVEHNEEEYPFYQLLMKSDMVVYPKLSDADKKITHEKICPDCGSSLEYDQADPAGKDVDIYYCKNCIDVKTEGTAKGEVKEFHISYDSRIDGYHTEISF